MSILDGQPLTFRPAPIDGSTAVEVWDGPHLVATIYGQAAAIKIVAEPGYGPQLPVVDYKGRTMRVPIIEVP